MHATMLRLFRTKIASLMCNTMHTNEVKSNEPFHLFIHPNTTTLKH
jgi:hypothetical protein